MRPSLPAKVIVTRPDGRPPIELFLSSPFDIGRDPRCGLVLADVAASKKHARIELRGDRWWLVDQGSRNGTLVDDRLVVNDATALSGGELLRIGQTSIRFTLDTRSEDQDDVETFKLPAGTVLLAARTTEQVHSIPTIADLGAVGIEQAYEKVRAALVLAGRIGASRDLEGLLTEVVEACVELLHADAAGLFEVQGSRAEPLACHGELQVSGTLVRRVAEERRGVLVADVAEDAALAAAQSVLSGAIRSMIAVPVVVFDEVFGVLALDSREQSAAFDEGDLEMLVALASQVGLAIERQRVADERAKEEAARAALSRFLSPDLVEQVRAGSLRLDRGGEMKEVAVLYSDIRGYTTWCERVGPQATVRGLNEYFERMVALVFDRGGTLDKFIGDALMATWGASTPAPHGARQALSCARDMMRELQRLNVIRAKRREEPLDIGIGVHLGPAMVGLIGAPQRVSR
ncbi:MAG: GAF domain-containing protein [Myxococcales bacterium]|nr:GAF domain-containing protein [Myxococcales bacterium]